MRLSSASGCAPRSAVAARQRQRGPASPPAPAPEPAAVFTCHSAPAFKHHARGPLVGRVDAAAGAAAVFWAALCRSLRPVRACQSGSRQPPLTPQPPLRSQLSQLQPLKSVRIVFSQRVCAPPWFPCPSSAVPSCVLSFSAVPAQPWPFPLTAPACDAAPSSSVLSAFPACLEPHQVGVLACPALVCSLSSPPLPPSLASLAGCSFPSCFRSQAKVCVVLRDVCACTPSLHLTAASHGQPSQSPPSASNSTFWLRAP